MTARLLIEYDGTDFSGWAKQPERRTVQGELERALATALQHPVKLTVAGRTDAGVHAWGQVASHPGEPAPLRALNALLPRDVAVLESAAAADDFDARHQAVSRTYCYRLLRRPVRSVFERRTAVHVAGAFDVDAFRACVEAIAGRHDFTAFTPSDGYHVRFERDVTEVRLVEDGTHLELWITADTFMRNMIRVLVGTLLEVARGVREADDFVALLDGAPRSAAGPTAPARGLALARVDY